MWLYKDNEEESIQIIKEACAQYGKGLYALSGFGADAGLLLSLMHKSGIKIPVLTIDTGFLFPETHLYKFTLQNKFGFRVVTYGPYKDEIEQIAFDRLWEKDIDSYHRIVKIDPLKRAVEELGVEALLQGVRVDQAEAKSNLGVVEPGSFGESRIYPILKWKRNQVDSYFSNEKIPRNLLVYEGYESIGDWTTTVPGFGLTIGKSGQVVLARS